MSYVIAKLCKHTRSSTILDCLKVQRRLLISNSCFLLINEEENAKEEVCKKLWKQSRLPTVHPNNTLRCNALTDCIYNLLNSPYHLPTIHFYCLKTEAQAEWNWDKLQDLTGRWSYLLVQRRCTKSWWKFANFSSLVLIVIFQISSQYLITQNHKSF